MEGVRDNTSNTFINMFSPSLKKRMFSPSLPVLFLWLNSIFQTFYGQNPGKGYRT